MFIVFRPITAKIRRLKVHYLIATKPQTNSLLQTFLLAVQFLMPDWLFSYNTITFQKYFWCSRLVFPIRLSTQLQENWTSQSFLYSRLQFRVTNVNQIKIHLLPPHLRPHYWFGSTAAHTCSALRIPLAASHASCSSSGTS